MICGFMPEHPGRDRKCSVEMQRGMQRGQQGCAAVKCTTRSETQAHPEQPPQHRIRTTSLCPRLEPSLEEHIRLVEHNGPDAVHRRRVAVLLPPAAGEGEELLEQPRGRGDHDAGAAGQGAAERLRGLVGAETQKREAT